MSVKMQRPDRYVNCVLSHGLGVGVFRKTLSNAPVHVAKERDVRKNNRNSVNVQVLTDGDVPKGVSKGYSNAVLYLKVLVVSKNQVTARGRNVELVNHVKSLLKAVSGATGQVTQNVQLVLLSNTSVNVTHYHFVVLSPVCHLGKLTLTNSVNEFVHVVALGSEPPSCGNKRVTKVKVRGKVNHVYFNSKCRTKPYKI